MKSGMITYVTPTCGSLGDRKNIQILNKSSVSEVENAGINASFNITRCRIEPNSESRLHAESDGPTAKGSTKGNG